MLVSQILANKGASVITVGPSVSAVALAQLFKTKQIGAAVVVGDHDEALGIVAERDIVNAVAQYTKKALKMRAHNLMRSPPTICCPNDNLKDVMALMINRRVRHVVAIEGNLLCGIVSIGDVLKPHLDETALEINVLRDYARLSVYRGRPDRFGAGGDHRLGAAGVTDQDFGARARRTADAD